MSNISYTDFDYGMTPESIATSFAQHVEYTTVKDRFSATKRDFLHSLMRVVRDRVVDNWNKTQQSYYTEDVRRVYYLSLEYLLGRLLKSAISNLKMKDATREALNKYANDLEEIQSMEWDAGLGNGGLGRLAACFLDSMATLGLPAYGYGIRYDYGIFFQRIENGYQIETPDNWLRYGNHWEIPRPEVLYKVSFYGRVRTEINSDGYLNKSWTNTDDVMAMAYDYLIPGYGGKVVNTLRLWSAKSTREFDLDYFNHGNYEQAVESKNRSENISRVLYPNDNFFEGKELRLKQEYFFVSATLQDAIRRHLKLHKTLENFHDKNIFQLNDTHPSIAVVDFMRILLDEYDIEWEKAMSITQKSFAYTNHTLLPEALEKWPVSLLERVLPRHLEIIYEINLRFLNIIRDRYPGDLQKISRLSMIEESPVKSVRMAHLAIVCSSSTNGVAKLHTEILKKEVLPDFNELFPERFNNKTNGITPRRWLLECNPELATLITEKIGPEWITNLNEIQKIEQFKEDEDFHQKWNTIKHNNKLKLMEYIKQALEIEINPESIYDVQIKRMHEYKRQLLNVLHIIMLYNELKDHPDSTKSPRTFIISGKAAPGYQMAKLHIKLIHNVANIINNDPDTNKRLKLVFIPNYSVSTAEIIIPAANVSEQISTAGMEASGTGNMKMALNGALTLGTLDGANIEIMEKVGAENIFIFGLKSDEVSRLWRGDYDPQYYLSKSPKLERVLDMIQKDFFSSEEPGIFSPIINALLNRGDRYMVIADFNAYAAAHEKVNALYKDNKEWTKKSIINVSQMGHFSSDRTISQYAEEIWKIKPVNHPS